MGFYCRLTYSLKIYGVEFFDSELFSPWYQYFYLAAEKWKENPLSKDPWDLGEIKKTFASRKKIDPKYFYVDSVKNEEFKINGELSRTQKNIMNYFKNYEFNLDLDKVEFYFKYNDSEFNWHADKDNNLTRYHEYFVRRTDQYELNWIIEETKGFENHSTLNTYLKTQDNEYLLDLLFKNKEPLLNSTIIAKMKSTTIIDTYLKRRLNYEVPHINLIDLKSWLNEDVFYDETPDDLMDRYDDSYGEDEKVVTREKAILNSPEQFEEKKNFILNLKSNETLLRSQIDKLHQIRSCGDLCTHFEDLIANLSYDIAVKTTNPYLFILTLYWSRSLSENLIIDHEIPLFKKLNIPHISPD